MKSVACYIRTSADCPQGRQRREINVWLKRCRISPKNIRWYIDRDSDHQPRFDALQSDVLDDAVRAVVVWRLDRLSSSAKNGLITLTEWCDRSIRVVSVSQRIDIAVKDCPVIAPVLRGIVEMNRQTIQERTKAGLAAMRIVGRVGGRPKLTTEDPKLQLLKKLRRNRALSIDDICDELEISRSTYYRYVRLFGG